MKQIALILLFAVSLLGCKKTDDATTNNNNSNPSTSNPNLNIVSITDNGTTYTAYGYDQYVVEDSTAWGILTLNSDPTYGSALGVTVEGGKMPFKLDLTFQKGTADGLGKFEAYSTAQKFESYYDKQSYIAADTSSAIITSKDNRRVKGTFYVRFSNSTGKKVVTGSFDFYD
jgi:hypothetical protein